MMICLVKPLFEVADAEMRRSGKIDDTAVYETVLTDLIGFARKDCMQVTGLAAGAIRGHSDTVEFFLRISRDSNAKAMPLDVGEIVEEAVKKGKAT